MTPGLVAALERCRRAEKSQALFYRALGSAAEDAGEAALAERFHDLHADEQHHLSRLTARLVEVGAAPAALDDVRPPAAELGAWEFVARPLEEAEVARYQGLLRHELDPTTRSLVEAILEVERQHATELGGKWTMA